MFSFVKNTFTTVVAVPANIASVVLSPITTMIEFQRFSSPHTVLQQCLNKLEHLQRLINEMSAQRQRKIETAARRGTCHHLKDIQFELDRYVLLNSPSSP